MNAIDLFYPVQTPLFDHHGGSSWAFLGWLEQESDSLVRGDLLEVLLNIGDEGDQHGHMSIMATHMGVGRSRSIRQV